ncbi:hypothetical protein [Gemmatimonas sp.]|jgi:hypothetical protein|uniref:hypothetical protein n=1 Tax=Gemmatimonas sp. TaxID=1962908 RepID=UPI0025B7D396|nr:hypothetical protein [Gemmatimonas sp.]MCA2992068.1 hypothetical protein [Gemmatimonas sp.]
MTIEVTDRRRRLILDWTLVGIIAACVAAFFDLRSTVHAQTKAFEEMSARVIRIESDAKHAPENTATKADISRLEGRIDQLVNLMLTTQHRK